MNIAENIKNTISELPAKVQLIAVSKTQPIHCIMQAYHAGQRIFGENKVQELVSKKPLLPADIQWHMIGHLQSNKVKYIAPFVAMIHSVDSLKLLREINKEAEKNHRIIPCLLECHIAEEQSKYGLTPDETKQILGSPEFKELKYVTVKGLMGMASFVEDEVQIRKEFRTLKEIFTVIKKAYFINDDNFSEISMGMSSDYKIAIEEGSTMVRIGSNIFGERNYR